MNRWMSALALSLCLCLTACGGPAEERGGQASFLEQAAGLEGETALLSVDGREIPAWRYLYWLGCDCDQTAARYEEAGLPLDWETMTERGTLAEAVKELALADTVLYAVVESWGERYGCAPAEEIKADLPDQGLSEERMAELGRVGGVYAALYQLYDTEGSALAPTAEALAAFGQETGALTLDRLLVPAGEDREAARQRAAALFSQLNSAQDQGALFASLAAGGGDPAGPRTVLPGEDGLDETLLAAARALEENQCSGIVESEEGFSILRRLPLDEEGVKLAHFNHLLETAAEAAEVQLSQGYVDLDAAGFYRERERLRAEEGVP
nr:hypothetical protein [uncultured Dysosmobacter sp.]